METNPFKNERILTLGFCLSLIPEVVLECAYDSLKAIGEKIDDAMDVWSEDGSDV
jgi:hypothetical protein